MTQADRDKIVVGVTQVTCKNGLIDREHYDDITWYPDRYFTGMRTVIETTVCRGKLYPMIYFNLRCMDTIAFSLETLDLYEKDKPKVEIPVCNEVDIEELFGQNLTPVITTPTSNATYLYETGIVFHEDESPSDETEPYSDLYNHRFEDDDDLNFLDGNPDDDDAYYTFCMLHPIEAFTLNASRFSDYFRQNTGNYSITNAEIYSFIQEQDSERNQQPVMDDLAF